MPVKLEIDAAMYVWNVRRAISCGVSDSAMTTLRSQRTPARATGHHLCR
jgi:hypothetical protein